MIAGDPDALVHIRAQDVDAPQGRHRPAAALGQGDGDEDADGAEHRGEARSHAAAARLTRSARTFPSRNRASALADLARAARVAGALAETGAARASLPG